MKINKKIKVLLLSSILTVSLGSLIGCTSEKKDADATKTQEETTTTYNNLKGDKAVKLIKDTKDILILDVRDAKEYEAGHIANAINIPVDDLEGKLSELDAYKDKTVLAYCRVGKRSAKASELLMKNGFSNVNNAEDGIEEYEYDLVKYTDINGYDAEKLIAETKDIVILDVRDEKEYKDGHIENAINIPVKEIENRIDELKDSKDKTILIYCKSGRRSADTAKILQEKGFTKVYNSVDGVSEYGFKLVK